LLDRGIETDDEHSAIVGSHSSKSYRETEAIVYMDDIPEEIENLRGKIECNRRSTRCFKPNKNLSTISRR